MNGSDLEIPGNALGMETLKIKDEQIYATGNHKDGNIECHAYFARLNTDKCWIATDPVRYHYVSMRHRCGSLPFSHL